MKNLAIDTSSEVCGVALLEDNNLIDDNSLNNGRTHSENLMILVEEILKRNNVKLSEIDLISVVVGPGSFTGIRIGVATVKALAEVNDIKLAEVTSLESLSQNITDSKTKVSLIDARNDQVYCGIFDENNKLKEDYIADSINVVVHNISKYDNVTFVGNGAIKFKNLLIENFKDCKFSEENEQIAKNAGIIGYNKYVQGNLKDANTILPIYLRKSQAERMKK